MRDKLTEKEAERLDELSTELPWLADWIELNLDNDLDLDCVFGCPETGGGVHLWIFESAKHLHRFFKEDEESLFDLLVAATAECGRDVPEQEIREAIKNSHPERVAKWVDEQRAKGRKSGGKWPPKNYVHIEEIGLSGSTADDLIAASPAKVVEGQAGQVLDLLFPGNPLICCGLATYSFETLSKNEWIARPNFSGYQFCVPSPMSKPRGLTRKGELSARSLDNTGPRRFLVVECDFKEKNKDGEDTPDAPTIRRLAKAGRTVKDLCAAIIAHLASYAPLVLVVHSGGKSLHGWFAAVDVDDARLDRFERYAVSLGGDPMTFTRCQFVRLPEGTRSDGKRQRVLYFSPALISPTL